MRVLWIAALFAIVSLSGCSGSGGLGAYLVMPGDLPAACHYMDYNGPAGKQLQEHYGWTGNPGRFDPDQVPGFFGDESMEVVDNLVALYECDDPDEGDVFSMALRFRDLNATAFLDDPEECDDAALIVHGPVVAVFDVDIDGFGKADRDALAKKIAARTGATTPCLTA